VSRDPSRAPANPLALPNTCWSDEAPILPVDASLPRGTTSKMRPMSRTKPGTKRRTKSSTNQEEPAEPGHEAEQQARTSSSTLVPGRHSSTTRPKKNHDNPTSSSDEQPANEATLPMNKARTKNSEPSNQLNSLPMNKAEPKKRTEPSRTRRPAETTKPEPEPSRSKKLTKKPQPSPSRSRSSLKARPNTAEDFFFILLHPSPAPGVTHPPVPAQPRVGGSCLRPVIQDGRALLPLRRRGGGASPLCWDRSLTIKLNHSASNRFLVRL